MGNTMEQFMAQYGDQLASAKKRLGKSHVLHPEYSRKDNPAHSLTANSYHLENFSFEMKKKRREAQHV